MEVAPNTDAMVTIKDTRSTVAPCALKKPAYAPTAESQLMKKKYRDIIVNNIQYAWRAHSDCDGDGHCLLTIWKNKKVVYEQLANHDITPAYVALVIGDHDL